MGQSLDSLNQLPRPLGPFTLIRLIAQGGMGSVFLALRPVEGEPTDEVCVVKTVRTDLKDDREAVGRFLDEARVVQKLDHPAICHTLDAGFVDKNYYLALEFISGRNLRDIHTRAQKLGKKVPEQVIFHALTEVLSALEYAHSLEEGGKSLGIVHRDVSPHNVMLGFDGHVKLIDFGLAAHILKKELTRPGIMVGKLRYNAPEQVRDRALDGRSDLYSVGVMLYELVVNERFYEGLSEEDIWRVAMKGTFRPRLYDKVPSILRPILDLALAPNPEERFEHADDMRTALLDVAGSRGMRDARRFSAKFMSEIFADERQAEREMILQATGLAEARTRLFQAPDSVDDSSVGRTKIVSPAEVRGKLADLVSGFDPNAETQMPTAPIGDLIEALAADRAARDPDVFADSVSDHTAPSTDIQGFDELDAPPAPERKRNVDENLKPNKSATTIPPETKSSLKRKSQQADIMTEPVRKRRSSQGPQTIPPASVMPLPQSRSVAAAPAPAPAILLGGIVLAAVVLLVAVIIALPRLMDDNPKKHAITVVEAPPDEKPPPVPDKGADHADDKPPPVPEKVAEHVDEKVPVDDTPPPPPPEKNQTILMKPVEHVEHVHKPVEKVEKPVVAVEKGPPPQKELHGIKEQVDYLKQYCMERVQCAKGNVEEAAHLNSLSVDDTKQLMVDIPKCIARCQR